MSTLRLFLAAGVVCWFNVARGQEPTLKAEKLLSPRGAEEAVLQYPENSDAWFNLATIYATERPPRMDRSQLCYRRVLALDGEADSPLEELIGWAAATHARKDGERPVKVPEKLLAKREESERLGREGKYAEALALSRRLASSAAERLAGEGETVEKLCFLGNIQAAAGKSEEATATLWRAVKLQPASAEAHCQLGRAYLQRPFSEGPLPDAWERASREFSTALSLDPGQPEAWWGLAIALRSLDPQATDRVRESYVMALAAGSQPDAALEEFLCIRGMEEAPKPIARPRPKPAPSGREQNRERWVKYWALKQRDRETDPASSSLLEEIVRHDPEDQQGHSLLGASYFLQARMEEARKALTTALSQNPKDAVAHQFMGLVASSQGSTEAAKLELETALALDPKYADAWFNLAVLFVTQTPPELEKARRCYEQAKENGAEADSSLEQLLQ